MNREISIRIYSLNHHILGDFYHLSSSCFSIPQLEEFLSFCSWAMTFATNLTTSGLFHRWLATYSEVFLLETRSITYFSSSQTIHEGMSILFKNLHSQKKEISSRKCAITLDPYLYVWTSVLRRIWIFSWQTNISSYPRQFIKRLPALWSFRVQTILRISHRHPALTPTFAENIGHVLTQYMPGENEVVTYWKKNELGEIRSFILWCCFSGNGFLSLPDESEGKKGDRSRKYKI